MPPPPPKKKPQRFNIQTLRWNPNLRPLRCLSVCPLRDVGTRWRNGGTVDEWGVFFSRKYKPWKLGWQWKDNHLNMYFLIKWWFSNVMLVFLGLKPSKTGKAGYHLKMGWRCLGKSGKFQALEIIIIFRLTILLMEEILHHLGCKNPRQNNGISTSNLHWWVCRMSESSTVFRWNYQRPTKSMWPNMFI